MNAMGMSKGLWKQLKFIGYQYFHYKDFAASLLRILWGYPLVFLGKSGNGWGDWVLVIDPHACSPKYQTLNGHIAAGFYGAACAAASQSKPGDRFALP